MTSFNRPELLSLGLDSLSRQDISKEDLEVIVLNDGDPDDGTDAVCELFEDFLNIKYFAAQHKENQWRVPGFAINFGFKQSVGEFVFISCAEMYHMDNTVPVMLKQLETGAKILSIPKSGRDDDGTFLNKLIQNKPISDADYNPLPVLHNIHFPFFMGMRREEFYKIGGYDEEFTGMGFDDNDFVFRMEKAGNRHLKTDCRVVHLYHPRLNVKNPEVLKRFSKNEKMFYGKKSRIIRNINKDWGNSF